MELEFGDGLGLPKDAVSINRRAWLRDLDGLRAIFIDQSPFFCYPLDDPVLHRLCAIQLVEAGIAKVKDVCCAFELHPRNFSRLRTKLLRGGIAGLFPETSGPKTIRTSTLAAGIVLRYRKGDSCRDVATQLGISVSTVRRVLKEQGVPIRSPFDNHQSLLLTDDDGELQQPSSQNTEPQVTEPQVSEPQVSELQVSELQVSEPQASEPQVSEPQASEPQAVEATSIPYASPLDRVCTVLGLIEEAPLVFQSADGVPNAGVLLGLALLDETHLLEEARAVYGRLKNGWYGLRSLVWTLVVMALVRIKRPEQIKHYDPVGLGCVLGLPRAAEVKTIRRKLSEIAQRGQAVEWHRRLARRRAEQQPSALATLYVDGHVRAYHGQQRLGKTHVSRLKRVMRAETDYWVHQAHGQPLLVVHESVDSSFRETLRDGVLPEIRRVIGDRRVRIVFDREGWSRELFDDLLRLNFDFITYRKGPYEPLEDSEFATATFCVPGQPAVHYELAETVFEQAGWPRLRLVAVKKQNGGQTHVLASGRLTWEALDQDVGAADLPAAELAWWMFHRWSQENWFKYMRTEYALDVLVDYSVELDDADRLVVNPQWRELDRQVASARSHLERAQAKYARLALKSEEKTTEEKPTKEKTTNDPTEGKSSAASPPACEASGCACLTCSCRVQAREVAKLSTEYDALRVERGATPRKIRLADASDRDVVKLSYERKLFTDTIKLGAYEIETRLYEMLGVTYSNSETEGRGLIRSMLEGSGDIRVESETIEVHLDQLSAPRYTQAMQSLCAQINALSPRLPETSHRLRFFVKPRSVGE
ncbi:MAG: putative transposase [Dokdonella sp.]